ncbi:JAB domain-containing protein [Clostridium gasigenes]|uniref:JAB domain-containing protein n=1 Tax=Clostridium gasigenes TaxID=94869 RepID=UPI001C0AB1DE|nr:JAB domain-containing protein [Clostridium gasigenes]MBU3137486.1 JAB domain-containing protein [Clostridium gasigenes]
MSINQAKRVNIVSLKMVKESSVMYEGRKISQPRDAVEIGRKILDGSDREKLLLCCFNTKNEPTSLNIVSIGDLNTSIVHPREVFKVAILSNSASIILFHNHPSGDSTPSKEDILVTERIKEVGKIMGINLIDHIILGDNDKYTSLKEQGII